MKLVYTSRARRHLGAIARYIGERNPDAARRVGARILPIMGHEGILAGTREMVVPGLPYIIVYRIESGEEEVLVILGVYHGAQLRPGQERL